MKVLFISRSTLFTQRGGDTVQVENTAQQLSIAGIKVDVHIAGDKIDYEQYDLIHFFNLTRPADILFHIARTNKPFVVSPILVDYAEYDKLHRPGLAGISFRFLSANGIEYIKTIARGIKANDTIKSFSYLLKGHRKSIITILKKTSMIISNSFMEYQQLVSSFSVAPEYFIAPNGIDSSLFQCHNIEKDPDLVICAARIEGIKNQLNLIKALNGTKYRLLIIGSPAVNQTDYYHQCKKLAAKNIEFIEHLPQNKLALFYQKAKVHVLPSWFETCGLSSLEAASMGCNIVVSNKGFVSEYFEDMAWYCDPASPASILKAVEDAAMNETKKDLQQKIVKNYTWKNAATKTAEAYHKVLQQ